MPAIQRPPAPFGRYVDLIGLQYDRLVPLRQRHRHVQRKVGGHLSIEQDPVAGAHDESRRARIVFSRRFTLDVERRRRGCGRVDAQLAVLGEPSPPLTGLRIVFLLVPSVAEPEQRNELRCFGCWNVLA